MGAAAIASESTRERLLSAASEVFSERGYDGAGVAEIARRAGLTTGAIYSHFDGKAQLLLEAIGARSAAELDQLLSARASDAAMAQRLVDVGAHLIHGRPGRQGGLLIEALVAARRDDDLRALVQSLLGERHQVFSRLFEVARADGDVHASVDTDALATFALILALGSLLYTATVDDRPAEDAWEALIRQLVHALKEEPRP